MSVKINKKNKGFVVLYTVLIASIILAITIGISSISFGEIVLSAEAREGNIAFFAADTGAECALYHDRVLGTFSGPQPPITCDGEVVSPVSGEYEIPLNDNDAQCAIITIDKSFLDVPNTLCYVSSQGCTRIEARGYNVPCGDIGTNPKVIERAIRVTYENVTGGPPGPTPPPTPVPVPVPVPVPLPPPQF